MSQTAEEQQAFWLSPQQERIWNAGGNAVAFVALDPPDIESLRSAVTQLILLNEPLRTVYRRMAGMKLPFQTVLAASEPVWKDAADLPIESVLQAEHRRVFDREHGPVLCVSTVTGGLVLSVPAVTADVPSLRILGQQLRKLLQGESLAAPDIRYVQFAQWQRDLLEDEETAAGRHYWASIRPASTPALPGENAGSDRYESDSIRLELPEAPVPVLLAAWQSLLWRLTGQAEFATDVFFPQRDYEELAGAVGLIGKQLPVNCSFESHSHFSVITEKARAALEVTARSSDAFPGGEISPAIVFDWADAALGEAISGGGKLRLSCRRGGALLQFNAALLDRQLVQRWGEYLCRLLTAALARPDVEVGSLPLIGKEERDLLDRWNRTAAEYPKERCFHELFEIQATETPDLPAVRYLAQELTYRQLNERANRLAWHLRSLGVGPDTRVALCLERCTDAIVALLGILKAGGAFVPLNGENPKLLLAQQLAGSAVLITQRELVSLLPEFSGNQILLEDPAWQAAPAGNPGPAAGPENLMYVIFTSGSTGVPKGVGVRHRNLVNYAWHIRQTLPGERMHFATVSTLSADLGNTCIYPALLSGGCVHIIPRDVANDSSRMAAYQRQYPVDVLKIVPSHLNALLETAEGRGVLPRRHLITGGETLTRALVDRIHVLAAQTSTECEIWNHYGPTETTVGSLMLRLRDLPDHAQGGNIPIGRPIANTQVHILNDHRELAPVGATGELYIGGAGVTSGYLGQPELTAERFPDGMYRTGDLARFLPDGHVEFLGRADDQIKIRGFRIELGEIEAALRRHPAVRQAVVLARDDNRGGRQLAAWVTARDGDVAADGLLSYLKTQVPDYMVPADVVILARMPLTSNGKIDRLALPDREQARRSGNEYVAPAGETEEAIAAIWASTLRRERIGAHDDFFAIGGHSLLATQIAARLRERFHTPVPVRMIFEFPTIRALAAELASRCAEQEAEDDEFDEIIPAQRTPALH